MGMNFPSQALPEAQRNAAYRRLAAVVLGHIPLGIWYLVTAYSKSMITLWDWVFGILYIVLFISIGMKVIGYRLLADKDSAYPFAPEEMERFNRSGHLARLGTLGGPNS